MPPLPPPFGFEDLFDNAPCGYLTLGPDGRIEMVNATLLGWVGRSREELVGRKVPELLNVAGRIFYETHFAPLLRMQGFLNEIALDLKTSEGKRRAVLANAVERRQADGRTVATYVVLFPASERRRYERDLVEARAVAEGASKELAALNKTLGERIEAAVAERVEAEAGLLAERETAELREQFIAVLGHDLRNPLASISAAARVLLREPLSERGVRVLALMQGSVTRMAGLIDNVLDFARGRLGGGIGLVCDADEPLESVLIQVVDELRAGAPDRLINTEFSLTEPVFCDRSRIGQLVSNLLGNALTYGAIDEPVRVQAFTEAGVLEISVANGGQPISEESFLNLFQPFFRGKVLGSQQGLGLGLHIASEIAKAHGGTISVVSDQIETRFTFRMQTAGPQRS